MVIITALASLKKLNSSEQARSPILTEQFILFSVNILHRVSLEFFHGSIPTKHYY